MSLTHALDKFDRNRPPVVQIKTPPFHCLQAGKKKPDFEIGPTMHSCIQSEVHMANIDGGDQGEILTGLK